MFSSVDDKPGPVVFPAPELKLALGCLDDLDPFTSSVSDMEYIDRTDALRDTDDEEDADWDRLLDLSDFKFIISRWS